MASLHQTTVSVSSIRLMIMVGVVFVFGAGLIYRLADLQILQASMHLESAEKQHGTIRTLSARRGEIFFKESASTVSYPVANNRIFNHLFVIPKDIQGIERSINALLPLMEEYDISEDLLRFRLSKENDIYEPLLHKLTDQELAPFVDLGMPGLAWEEETSRYYPEGNILSHITGFVGVQNEKRVGQYGLEGIFEKELAGVDGLLQGESDISGRLIQTSDLNRKEPEQGIDLVLTIDRTLQSYACRKLAQRVEEVEAIGGTILMVNPKTGEVLVMCSEPSFDPNNYNKVEDISVYVNPSVAQTYEPGSIFKPFTMSGGIDTHAVTSQTTYIDKGVEEIGKYKIKNSDLKAHGEVDMVTVLNESLNTGAIFVQRELGKDRFVDYVEKFGFGRTTDIELGNELSGNISSLNKAGDIYVATASFGQGITATPMQLVMAYAALANGGKLMQPYIVSEKLQNGVTISVSKPVFVDEVISVRASAIISGMLVSVVRNGHAGSAGVDGYYIAGKTGTAQVASEGEYGKETIHSFAGYGPIDNPVFAMLVKLDHPQIGRFSSSTAAPLFGDISKFILQYYDVPPDEVE